MTRVAHLALAVVVFASLRSDTSAQQTLDPEFDAKVDRPAYTDRHPKVLFDEAHNNFHTSGDRYKPFADLIKNDGYAITPNTKKFSGEVLKGYEILVIANAQGAPMMNSPDAAKSAYTAAECDAVRDWVRAGGELLLIADHHPWGSANEAMGTALGVEMGKSVTRDPVNSEVGLPAQLIFSRENNLMGDHPILSGRDGSERIDRVQTFGGQSLKGPDGSVMLLPLSKSAVDQSRPVAPGRSGSVLGRAQGVAFTLGKGRVVVLGEAGMLTAQINGRIGKPMGMNVPGIDNKQFALNAMHWLSGLKSSVETAKPTMAGTNPPAASARREESRRPLSSAEIAAESEASIALITDDGAAGTGFLVAPGLMMTNSHVIDDAFLSNLRVRFPSAEKAQQGPFPAELLYEDARRDLAFVRVKSNLPPLHIARSFTYRKGEEVTVIGNPAIGTELVIENAISRGVMSSKTTFDNLQYYQLSISVNPGNSGGPVFDSTGRVIGVLTRGTRAKEGIAFAIPVEDLNLAFDKVTTLPQDAINREKSRHRLIVAVKGLGGGGALYSYARSTQIRTSAGRVNRGGIAGFYDTAIAQLEKQTLPKLRAEITAVHDDPLVAPEIREKIGQLSENLDKLKKLATEKASNVVGGESFTTVKGRHRRLLVDVYKSMKLEVPEFLLDALEDVTQEGSDKTNDDSSKKKDSDPPK